MRKTSRYSCVLSVCLLLAAPAVFAQQTGDIQGAVTDADGKPLPGVTVEATSPAFGARVATTGTNGNFRILSLTPGTYKVKATLSGFTTVEKTAIVPLGATANVNMQLKITAKEEVVVSGEAPIVDVSSTTTGSNYSAKVTEKLPIGRNYASVVQLQPGVQPDTGDRQGRGLALSIYGSTSAENMYVIDGVNTNQVERGVQGKIINNEFIQEVEVKTGGYQAEYGRATGGIINVITKSGGNEFHGDAFVNYAPQGIRANQIHQTNTAEGGDNFNTAFDSVREADYGADLGGFFVKDHLWFFAAYNGDRGTLDRVPQQAASVLNQHFEQRSYYNLLSSKLTWNIAEGSTLVGTYFRDPEHRDGAVFTPTGTNVNQYSGRLDIGSDDYAGRFNQLFGSFGVLNLQYSKHHDRFLFTPLDPNAIQYRDRTHPEDYPFFPTSGGFGRIAGFRYHNLGNRDEYVGSFTGYVQNHEIKFGGDYVKNVTAAITSYTGTQRVQVRLCSSNSASVNYCPPGEGFKNYVNTRGETVPRVYFQHDFYADALGSLTPVLNSPTAPPSKAYSGFIQDTWRVTPHLSINAGVRYDVERIQNAQNVTVIDLKNEWQPRVGITFDFVGDGSSKLYASFGRYYYVIPNDLNVRVYGSEFDTSVYSYSPTSTASGTPGTGPPNRKSLFQGATAEPIDNGIKGTYSDEFTLGVEKAMTSTFAVGLKGTYRKLGRVIEDRCDLDYTAPINGGSSCAITNPGSNHRWAAGVNSPEGDFPWCDNAGSTFVSPTAQTCFANGAPSVPAATRKFTGIELTARKAFTQNLWAQFSYLWSRLRGNYDGAVRVASGQTDPGINADYDYPLFLRNADGRLYLDRPHQLRLDAVYTAPFGLTAAIGAYYRSGPPISRYGWYNDFYPDLLHLVPRGQDSALDGGRLPGQYEANISLGYTFKIGAVSITPAVYIFNVLNRQGVTDVSEDFNPQGTFCENKAGCTPTNTPDYTQRNFGRLGTIAYGDPLPDKNWGKPTNRQDPRTIRLAFKISI
jgi:outer membrane receptor protein involved in Fe transport